MIYILSFGRTDSRILGVFTSEQEAEEAKDRIVRSQLHPRTLLFIEEFEANQLRVDADMLV